MTELASKDMSNLRMTSRSSEKLRNQMLSRLSQDRIWLKPQDKPIQSQTAIIFDWDDTILCTSILAPYEYLLQNQMISMPPALQKCLNTLDLTASKLLTKVKTYGRVYIVTNATEGWVEMSAARFLPKVREVIQSDITIISARTKFEKLYPRDPQEWKIQAFLETRADMEEEAITNLIALGDNDFEILAAYILGKQFNKSIIKTVKFRQTPNFSELTKQLKLVNKKFEQIFLSAKNLTVELLRSDEYRVACEEKRNQKSNEDLANELLLKSQNVANNLDKGSLTSAAMM